MADLLTETGRPPCTGVEPDRREPGGSGAESAPGGRDEVELALMQARRLIESTVSLHRSRPARGSLIVMGGGDEALGAAVERLVHGARHSISAALPGESDQHGEVVQAALAALAAAAQRGVTVRLLCHERLLSMGAVAAFGRRGAGCEVRVAQGELQPILIADGRTSLVRPVVERTRRQVAIVTDPAAVRAIDLLFAGAWGSAARLPEYQRLHERLRTDFAQNVLRRLCEGCTDLVAARESHVSLRTYRRHVAEIMQLLGASSRFQAGVRAVELGLLPAP